MYKIGVIGIPGAWSTERLAQAVKEKTGFSCIIDMSELTYNFDDKVFLFQDKVLPDLDAIIVKKIGSFYSPDQMDRIRLLKHLATRGIRFFSSPDAISESYSRLSCTLRLLEGDILIPPTVLTESIESACQAVTRFGEVILKPLYSTKAKGMILLSADDSELKKKLTGFQEAGNRIIYIQKRVRIPGKDLGLVFLGGRYIATYARVGSLNSWNTTTTNGGKYESYTPDDNIIELAHRAQNLFNLDFTSVDIAETDEGPVVFEVSAFGGFRGLYETSETDPAELYADYVLQRLSHD